MKIVINHDVKLIKNGYLATAKGMRMAAQGYNEETAKANLEHGVRLFLQPFQRNGTLEYEIEMMGLTVLGNGHDNELTIILE